MIDFSAKPYAKWIDNSICELFEVDPDSIFIGIIKDGEVSSNFWNVGQDERAALIQEILALGVFEVIEKNRDKFRDMALETLNEFLEKRKEEEEEEEIEDSEEAEDE